MFGHFVGPLIFNALADALPYDVQADSGMVFQTNLRGQTRAGKRYSSIYFSAGGYGALAGYDGRAALPAPANIIGGSVEFWEEQINCTFLQKEILPDTGGAGGGGYGAPERRSLEAITSDLQAGLISGEFAKRHYPRQCGR